ncbi:helix-turn-helix transcriptional regulator [Roseateles sp. DAIF2]|uniref:helix-turn-helix domain-containing protein n=1 Tax=Roseateles sp. DAIF2 TaxID=2714952 RepID=UPI0018A2D896|nr:AraC family transcriptional regulator [Roseateles sp. DAIF2]QPF71930.1 helix-turn-helix transcriptional regulator [Roseateles sp. DAIF2]
MTSLISLHSAFERMPRHRHGQGYVALVLAGGYVEAGDRGRMRVEAGQAVFHGAHESHRNEFFGVGARVLNLPVPAGGIGEAPLGRVDDADAIARLAERDPGAAAQLLRQSFRPSAARLNDWPDLLAAALAEDPALGLAEWADRMGIAPPSISRGFKRAYGTSPKRYRLELRVMQALRRLRGWQGSLAALAAETGFADQAHLTRAIVALTGQTPTRLMMTKTTG